MFNEVNHLSPKKQTANPWPKLVSWDPQIEQNIRYSVILTLFIILRSHYYSLRSANRAFLEALWWRIYLPMQETWVPPLIREDPTCWEATKSLYHNYWACALEPRNRNYWSLCPRAHAPQQEKLLQWEVCVLQLEKSACSNKDTAQPKINKIILKSSKYRKLKILPSDYGSLIISFILLEITRKISYLDKHWI